MHRVFRPIGRITALLSATLLISSCNSDGPGSPATGPTVNDITVDHNATNVLAASVTFRTSGTDSVRVAFTPTGGVTQYTPFRPASGDREVFPVLGLRPATEYSFSAQAYGGHQVSQTADLTLETDQLPAGLADVHMTVTGTPTQGYTVTTIMPGDGVGYLVAFDSLGQVAWYRGLNLDTGELVTDIHRWPNGNYTMFAGITTGWQPTFGRHVEITPAGDLRREFRAPAPYYTDNHELLLQFQDTNLTSVALFGYDLRRTDLTAIGGSASTLLAGHQLLRLTPAGTTEFFWNAWDFFKITDWIERAGVLGLDPIDFDHPNSLSLAENGDYLVSWRHLAEVTKIQSSTGRVIWRLGGVNNQFTFVDDPENGFSAQHYVRSIGPDQILVYDNGVSHQVPESRMAQYQIDETAKVARLVWEYRHNPAFLTPTRGSVDRLTSGNTFIGWATLAWVQEVTPDKTTVWEGQVLKGNDPQVFYRAIRTRSLYQYQAP